MLTKSFNWTADQLNRLVPGVTVMVHWQNSSSPPTRCRVFGLPAKSVAGDYLVVPLVNFGDKKIAIMDPDSIESLELATCGAANVDADGREVT